MAESAIKYCVVEELKTAGIPYVFYVPETWLKLSDNDQQHARCRYPKKPHDMSEKKFADTVNKLIVKAVDPKLWGLRPHKYPVKILKANLSK